MRDTTPISRIAPILLCLALGAAGTASADDDHRFHAFRGYRSGKAPVCVRSADRMLNACLFGLGDAQQTLLANCLNVGDAGERESCFSEAREARREELGECLAVHEARRDACDLLDEDRYVGPLESGIELVDPNAIPGTYAPSPFVSLAAGHTYVLEAGEEGEEIVVVHVTDRVREILGAPCRVVKDVVFERDEDEHVLVEHTDDWFAQDVEGNVYYCGEIARNYEDGLLRDLEGSFEAGVDFAKSGDLVRRFPAAGDAHRQEYALGEAEDIAEYVALDVHPGADEGGENTNAPQFECEANGGCLKMRELTPLEPDTSEFKYYVPGLGFVLAVGLEEGEFTGEREELICVGDTLDGVLGTCVLDEDSGETAADALAGQLCGLDPATFAALCP